MPLTVDQLAEEALRLPLAARAELAEKLVESFDLPPDDVEAMWIAEAERRLDDLRNGRVQLIPGEDVLAEVRRIAGR